MRRDWMGRAVGGVVLVAILVLMVVGWRARGHSHFQKAREQYRALLDQSKRPTDPAFDPVIQELEQVPPGSSDHAEAQRMLSALQAARARPPPLKPLVNHAPSAAEPADVAAKREACIELSQQLGQAKDEEARTHLASALKLCQIQLEEAQESHHSDNP